MGADICTKPNAPHQLYRSTARLAFPENLFFGTRIVPIIGKAIRTVQIELFSSEKMILRHWFVQWMWSRANFLRLPIFAADNIAFALFFRTSSAWNHLKFAEHVEHQLENHFQPSIATQNRNFLLHFELKLAFEPSIKLMFSRFCSFNRNSHDLIGHIALPFHCVLFPLLFEGLITSCYL